MFGLRTSRKGGRRLVTATRMLGMRHMETERLTSCDFSEENPRQERQAPMSVIVDLVLQSEVNRFWLATGQA